MFCGIVCYGRKCHRHAPRTISFHDVARCTVPAVRSVRKAEDAEALAAELGDFFSPLVFDVTDVKAIAAAAAEVRSRTKGRKLLGLVNNAGAPGPGPQRCAQTAEGAPAAWLLNGPGRLWCGPQCCSCCRRSVVLTTLLVSVHGAFDPCVEPKGSLP